MSQAGAATSGSTTTGQVLSFTPNSGTSPVVPNGSGNVTWQGTGSITLVGGLNSMTPQLTGLINHAIQVGAGTATLTQLAVGTTGQVLTGVTGSDPVWSNTANSIIVTQYDSGSGSWTANAATKYVKVYIMGGGGGGGSGRKGTSTSSFGGGGGSGGQVIVSEGPVANFSGAISYSVAAQANGGNAQTVDGTDGNPGSVGNNTTFGPFVALGGNFGLAGTAAAGTGGAARTFLFNFNTGTGNAGGNGASGNASGATARGSTNTNQSSPTGGGGGGGGDTVTARTGGAGAGWTDTSNVNIVAGAPGGIETGTANGSNGSTTITPGNFFGGFGGGGGGGTKAAAAGNGGDGSQPGGGGGGGGGGVSTVGNSGAGGKGAAGRIVVIEYT